jgi:hypothetical protein
MQLDRAAIPAARSKMPDGGESVAQGSRPEFGEAPLGAARIPRDMPDLLSTPRSLLPAGRHLAA